MPSITIQQAYAISMGIWQNPYTGGRLDGGTLLGNSLNASPNRCFKDDPTYLNVFSKTKNRLQRLLDGTSIDIPGIPAPTGPTLFDLGPGIYTLENTSTKVANSTTGGFETVIFEPREFIGSTRQNYNYRTGSDLNVNALISSVEQLYHLAGLGLINKLKK